MNDQRFSPWVCTGRAAQRDIVEISDGIATQISHSYFVDTPIRTMRSEDCRVPRGQNTNSLPIDLHFLFFHYIILLNALEVRMASTSP
jgi:hypothetical protein